MTSYDGRMSSFSSIPPTQHAPYANMTQTSPPHTSARASQSFGPPNGHANRPSHAGHVPQIYTAVYSGVAVYEMEVGTFAVMRRRSDSWLNATQILKVAAVDKGKRTKILEKEIHQGEHEKVQGGYGKYQGTWISYDRGRQFCRQYGVEDILKPLLEYDLANDGTGNKGTLDTPTKEQAMAANRKRFYNSGVDHKANGSFTGGTFFQGISPTASNAIAAMNKAARYDAGRSNSAARRSGLAQAYQSGGQPNDSQGSGFPGSQGSQLSFSAEHGADVNGHAFGSQQYGEYHSDIAEPPRKRLRPEPTHDLNVLDPALQEETPTEVNESFVASQTLDGEGGMASLPPMSASADEVTEKKRQALLALFEDLSRNDLASHPALQQLSGRDLDIPLDTTANTALHWAATLARVSVMKTLIAKGANIYQGNAANQTPLMAAVQVNNSYDIGCFPEMLDILGPLIEVQDATGRTVLHHIAVSSGIRGRAQSSRYYLESLLEFIVRQGSNPSSQQNTSFSNAQPPSKRPMNLGRFMSEVVNVQDKNGNTALNLVARIGNRPIINQLEEVGANFDIPNHTGFKPADFGVFPRAHPNSQMSISKEDPSSQSSVPASQVDQIKEEIFASKCLHHLCCSRVLYLPYAVHYMFSLAPTIACYFQLIPPFQYLQPQNMNSLIELYAYYDLLATTSILAQTQQQYQNELAKKQAVINQQNQELRDIATEIEQERTRLDEMQRRETDRAERRKKIENHKRANEERKAKMEARDRELGPAEPFKDPDYAAKFASLGYPIETDEDIERIKNLPEAEAEELLKKLPPPAEMQAHVDAYKVVNEGLQKQLASLQARSSETESKYRKVVSLCTQVPEAEVDGMLDQLLAAVTSEDGNKEDMGRVREFLRKVEDV